MGAQWLAQWLLSEVTGSIYKQTRHLQTEINVFIVVSKMLVLIKKDVILVFMTYIKLAAG